MTSILEATDSPLRPPLQVDVIQETTGDQKMEINILLLQSSSAPLPPHPLLFQ